MFDETSKASTNHTWSSSIYLFAFGIQAMSTVDTSARGFWHMPHLRTLLNRYATPSLISMSHNCCNCPPNVNRKLWSLLRQTWKRMQVCCYWMLVAADCIKFTMLLRLAHRHLDGLWISFCFVEFVLAFHGHPAWREDFTTLTGNATFPRKYCNHCWLENVPVYEKTIELLAHIKQYVAAVTAKKCTDSKTKSYGIVAENVKDQLLPWKLFSSETDSALSCVIWDRQSNDTIPVLWLGLIVEECHGALC